MEARWHVRLDRRHTGGTAAFVASGQTSDGAAVVLKIPVPDPGRSDEIGVLQRAEGRGYVRLLAHDAERGALLLEALGESLSASGLPPERQLSVLASLATTAWTVPRPRAGPAARPVNKAAGLWELVDRLWGEVEPDCPLQVRQSALASAERLSAAFDPATSVVVHGDAAAANALHVIEPRAGAGPLGYVFVDPDGFVGDPAYDLGVALRDWCAELLASPDPRALMARYAEIVASEADVDAATIQDWAFLERVSTGLTVLSLGAADLGAQFLQTATALL